MEASGDPTGSGYVDIGHLFVELMNCIHQDQLDRAKLLVEDLTQEGRETVSRLLDDQRHQSLLLTAISLGRTSFMSFLLEERCAYIEGRCICNYLGHHMSVSYLGCAAVFDNIAAVKTLVEHGACINGLDSQTTPVHAACYVNNVDIVQFLVENGADINQPDHGGYTCLIDSVNNTELCRFLIEQGAAVNAVDIQGYTALHSAIVGGHFDSVQLLLEHGADPSITNEDGDDALRRAALCDSSEIVEYLIQKLNPTPQRRADMYSLFAATMDGNLELALPFWIKSANIRMEELTEDPNEAVPVDPNAAYNSALEARDVDSVMSIAQDRDAMNMQALVARERILGPGHRKTICGVLHMALEYVDGGCVQRCLDLSKYALCNFRLELNRPQSSTFVKMLRKLYKKLRRIGKDCPYNIRREDLCDMLQCMVKRIAGITSTVAAFPEEQAILPGVALHLIHLLCLTGAETPTFTQLLRVLVRTRLRTSDGSTLLHIAVHPGVYVKIKTENEARIYNEARSAVVECLLTSGAAVNEVDSAGNTPLHVAVFNRPDTPTTDNSDKVIKLLLNHGAHIDIANANREVVSDKLPAADVFNHVSLACLAARAIRSYQLPYRGIVPETHADFVDFH